MAATSQHSCYGGLNGYKEKQSNEQQKVEEGAFEGGQESFRGEGRRG
jgi:hypothetical protein